MKCDNLKNLLDSNLTGKKILITGGTGFIGTSLVRFLSEFDVSLTVISRREHESKKNIRYLQIDLRNIDELSILEDEKFDYCIYLAANIPLAKEKKETFLDAKLSTFDSSINFFEIVLKNVSSFIFASSVDILGNCEVNEFDENQSMNNPTPYGIAKYAGELYAIAYCKRLGIPYKVLRFSQVYGPNEPIVRIIPILINSLENNEEFNLFTYGDEKRRFLFVDDAVQGIVRAMLSSNDGVFNIAGKEIITIGELINLIQKIWNKKMNLNVLNKMHGVDNVPAIKKSIAELGYNPEYSMEEGLRKVYEESIRRK